MDVRGTFPEVGRIERPEISRLEVGGADAKDFLHRMTSNDVAALRPGEGCAALLLERTGRIIDRLIVADLGGRLLLIGGPGRAAAVKAALEKYVFAEDVTVTDLAEETVLVTVAGTRSAGRLGEALGAELEELPRFHHREAALGADGALVVRAEDVAGRCFHVVAPNAARAALEERLAAIPRLERETWRALRVGSGVAEFGAEFSERTVAPELRMSDAVSFTKGCYPGQEIVARVRTYGQAKRTLVRVRIDGPEPPEAGAALVDGDAEVGRIASTVTLGGAVLGLGYVHTGLAKPGTRLRLAEGGGRPVEVLPLTPEGDPS